MTNLQAALGLAQMERIDEIISHRQDLFSWYKEVINTSSEIRLNFSASWAKNVYWLISIEVDWFTDELRSEFMKGLKEKGIDSRPYFYPISSMPMYQTRSLPVALKKSQVGINLPSYYKLTKEDVVLIGGAVNEVIDSLNSK